jgi:hypothetical protein
MKEIRCEFGLLALRIDVLLILIRRFANYVEKNILKKKISTGLAGPTE